MFHCKRLILLLPYQMLQSANNENREHAKCDGTALNIRYRNIWRESVRERRKLLNYFSSIRAANDMDLVLNGQDLASLPDIWIFHTKSVNATLDQNKTII